MYEAPQAEALAATLQRRLAADGRALLCCPIRDQVQQSTSLSATC